MLASISRKIVILVDNHPNQFAFRNNIWLAADAKVGPLRAKGYKLAFPKKIHSATSPPSREAF